MPIMAQYAGLDTKVNEGWPAFEAILKKNKVEHTAYFYPGVNHGFVFGITTLGFGDISATSELAQFFVIIEALFGVLSIGLFLNSLSIQYSEKISLEEKKKESDSKSKLECEKLIRHNNIIEQNINMYLVYIYEIATPLSKRNETENGFTILSF